MSDPQHFGLGELGQRVQAMSDPVAPSKNGAADPTPSDPRLRPYQGAQLPAGSLSSPTAPPPSSWEQVTIPIQSGTEQTSTEASSRTPDTPPAPASQSSGNTMPTDPPKSGFQRAFDAMRAAVPMVQKLLPLIDGNFATAVSALMAPQHHPAPPPPVQVDLEPVERGLAEVRNSNRELRTQVQEQGTTLKRVEDQLERVREATDRNTLEQQELVEDLRAVGSRISTFAAIGVILLLVSLALNGYLIFQLQHILR